MNELNFTKGERSIKFRYDIIRRNVKSGEAKVFSCLIKFDADAKIKRTAQFTLNGDGIDFLNDRIRAVVCINGTDYPVGTFILSTPLLDSSAGSRRYSVEAYDTTIILKEDCFTERTFFAAETRYDEAIAQIFLGAGISDYIIPSIEERLPTDREFEFGYCKLDAVNELLSEINYNPLVADALGRYTITKYFAPKLSGANLEYSEGALSVISSDMALEDDYYSTPNVFIARCDNPELDETYFSTYVNDNPSSKLSTTSRGRRIVSEVFRPDYIASQEALDEYVYRKAVEHSAVYSRLKISTAIMPVHGYHDVLRIRCGEIGGIFLETSWEMELRAGSLMTHNIVGVHEI